MFVFQTGALLQSSSPGATSDLKTSVPITRNVATLKTDVVVSMAAAEDVPLLTAFQAGYKVRSTLGLFIWILWEMRWPMVSALDSGRFGPWPGHCVVFLGKTLSYYSASLHTGV